MPAIADELLLEILRACSSALPDPLYPAAFAAYSGLDRGVLDEALDKLRLRGLLRFTDWIHGQGQGYTLTPEGARVVENPRLLNQVQKLPAKPPPSLRHEFGDTPWSRGEKVREALLNPTRPVICLSLIAINTAVFVVDYFLASQQGFSLKDWGAMNPAAVFVGKQWWRLLSCAFLHGGIMHIAMNMYALYILGPLVETMWGSGRFLVLYLIAAFTGSCAEFFTNRSAIGASGAICGVLTSFGVWVYLNRHYLPEHIVANWMRAVFTNILLIAMLSFLPGLNVSWEGHLGGALGGALVSVPLNYQRFGRGWQKILGFVGIPVVPLAFLACGLYQADRTYHDFDKFGVNQKRTVSEAQIVWRDLNPVFEKAENAALAAYNSVAVPLVNKWNKELDENFLKAAKVQCRNADVQLQEAAQSLSGAGPFRTQVVTGAVQSAHSYLEAWASYFSLLTKTLDAPQPWPQQQLKDIEQQLAIIKQAQNHLDARLFRSLINFSD